MTSNGAVLEVSFYGISEHPTEQFISIPKGLSEKELIFNLFTIILYREKVTWNEKKLYFTKRTHSIFSLKATTEALQLILYYKMINYTTSNIKSNL